jgi:hypothetical protein
LSKLIHEYVCVGALYWFNILNNMIEKIFFDDEHIMIEKILLANGNSNVRFYLASGELYRNHLLSKNNHIIFAESFENNIIFDKTYYI